MLFSSCSTYIHCFCFCFFFIIWYQNTALLRSWIKTKPIKQPHPCVVVIKNGLDYYSANKPIIFDSCSAVGHVIAGYWERRLWQCKVGWRGAIMARTLEQLRNIHFSLKKALGSSLTPKRRWMCCIEARGAFCEATVWKGWKGNISLDHIPPLNRSINTLGTIKN